MTTFSPHELAMWTIHESPDDYPDQFVVRRSRAHSGGGLAADPEPVAVVKTLEEARAAVPPFLYRLPRLPEDEISVVEVWL